MLLDLSSFYKQGISFSIYVWEIIAQTEWRCLQKISHLSTLTISKFHELGVALTDFWLRLRFTTEIQNRLSSHECYLFQSKIMNQDIFVFVSKTLFTFFRYSVATLDEAIVSCDICFYVKHRKCMNKWNISKVSSKMLNIINHH